MRRASFHAERTVAVGLEDHHRNRLSWVDVATGEEGGG